MKRSPNQGRIRLVPAASLALLLLFLIWLLPDRFENKPEVKIGVLFSLSGTMAASEAPLVDAVRLAVEQANQSGGVNGAQIRMIVADCRSDAGYCAQQAEQLLSRDGVKVLFGCWTSACRKAVKPVVERHHQLLSYPLQYEGLEESADIFYTGAVPNQQIIPAVMWALQNKHRRFYLLGSDDVYPHMANLIARDVLRMNGGEVLAERYLPMGDDHVERVVAEIARLKPDIVLNTLNGDSNNYFFRALHDAGISAADVPVISTSIGEVELAEIGPGLVVGDYAVWNYFQSIDTAENREFVAQFKQRFGSNRVLDDPMEAAYVGVRMWVDAAREAGSTDTALVSTLLRQQTLAAPEGIVSVDYPTMHLWKAVRIGRARADGQFDVVWQSDRPFRPAPFPLYHSRSEWESVQQSVVRQAGAGGQP